MKSGRKTAGNPAEQSEKIGRNTLKMHAKLFLDLRQLIILKGDTIQVP